ncbi:MAG: dTDP-4-dehydrorhamnose reductase [Bacteroidales bacterium]|nr:dTDP-4-dehydrorhamnose reductase [Bacteroidales bacterium]
MTRILVTGSNGQLGNEFRILSSKYNKYIFFFTDIEELDITDINAIDAFVKDNYINIIINCAAYTAVDNAEKDRKSADMINNYAVKQLALTAEKYNCFLFHISTDYVFDGTNHRPYVESDITNPLSVYGQTKLDGEKSMLSICKKSIIIRTSWLYSEFKNNFLKTILKYGKQRDELNIVFDQIGTPTYAGDLAETILEIISETKNISNNQIYHFSNEGVISWYDFAKEIIDISKIKCNINPIETKDYPLPAPRPSYSVLNKSKIKNHFKIKIPYWKDSLKVCLKNFYFDKQ